MGFKDELLAKRIVKNLTHPGNAKEALSRNRLRVGCMQMYGCHYPSAFPISVAVWIYKREAERRGVGKLACVVDCCAGWADRLAAAHISGVVEHFVAMDPWHVSNHICRRVHDKLSERAGDDPMRLTLLSRGAERMDAEAPWPDADLVFTSPPYAKLGKRIQNRMS